MVESLLQVTRVRVRVRVRKRVNYSKFVISTKLFMGSLITFLNVVSSPNISTFKKCLLINSLTTVGYLLEVFIRLWIPSMVRIFTSAWS